MEEWKEYKLGGITSKIGSGATPKGGKESYLGGNIALIRSQNILDFAFTNSGLVYINKDQASKLNNVEVKENDILLNITGDSVARVCIVPQKILPARVNQHVAIIRGNDIVDNRYLLYYLQYIKPYLLSLSQGGATRNALTKKMLEDLDIKVPSKNVQNIIISVLSSLDDKIELNRRINENLEQQAQALFKSWFVDFEPFKDGKFVDSEQGMIPEGWKVGNLEELVEVKYGKDHKKLAPGTIPVYGSGGIMRYVDQYLYNKESVLIPRKGSLNNVMYINRPFWTVDTMFYTRMKIEGIAKFIYLFMSPKDLLSMNSGSAVPSMTVDILNKIQIITPPINIIQKFECIMKPIFTKMDLCSYENQKLSQLRDTLLPRLMSGELEIKDNSYD